MPGSHTAKQKRQAKHVADSERKRGKSRKEAERIGWATVNKKKGFSGTDPSLTAMYTRATGVSAPQGAKFPSKPKAPQMGDPLDDPNYHAKPPTPVASAKPAAPAPAMPSAPKMTIGPRGRGAAPTTPAPRVAMKGGEELRQKRMTKMAGKSFQVMSIDELYALKKADAPLQGPPKKFPRKEKPTVKLKPIGMTTHQRTGAAVPMRAVGDEEAIARIKAGKHVEKADLVRVLAKFLMARGIDSDTSADVAKALATGYSKVSGGGALKAPNREPRGRRGEAGRPVDLSLSLDAVLARAMSVMPSPSGPAKPPKVYLPGVHNPKSPMRPKTGLKKPSAKKSSRPSTSSKDSPRALDGGGATELSNSIRSVVHKSEGATSMGKTNFNDLFKSELGTPDDETIIDCPHCDHSISKSDILKGGKGKKTEISGAKHGKSGAHVRDQNPEGGVTRGGDGRGQVKSSRGVPGAQKTDAVVGVQNGKGSKTRKSEDEDETLDDTDDQPQQPVVKSQKPQMRVRGTEFVQYIENEGPGGDAAIAKSIAEGALGGTPPTQPMDLNNDLSRLLT